MVLQVGEGSTRKGQPGTASWHKERESDNAVEFNSAGDVFPGVELEGNYAFVLLYLAIGLVFNIFGEEIYYFGYLLPRMRGAFGKWDWVVNMESLPRFRLWIGRGIDGREDRG